MATKFYYDSNLCSYNPETMTFATSEKNLKFDTSYELINPRTNGSEIFEFSHSTGPEFDPNTVYIYKSKTGLILEVYNDAEMTKRSAKMYLNGKLKK